MKLTQSEMNQVLDLIQLYKLTIQEHWMAHVRANGPGKVTLRLERKLIKAGAIV